ncbi:MAG: hypothetical protein AAF762_14915, partial [Pseudomonadota bacterium]
MSMVLNNVQNQQDRIERAAWQLEDATRNLGEVTAKVEAKADAISEQVDKVQRSGEGWKAREVRQPARPYTP